jgi:hypothetical protein
MGPFPFIRFDQAEINGNFGDEFTYRKSQLIELYDALVISLTTGTKLFIQINAIKAQLEIYNSAPKFSNLELDLPRPYVTGTGSESYTLYLRIQQNNSCFGAFVFATIDGVVDSIGDFFTPGPDLTSIGLDGPYIAEEIKISKTLSVYQQNGAAIFPDTFTYNPSTGIAERRLLRAYDWKFNETLNQPQRNLITDLRVIPKTIFHLRELTQIEKAMVSFFLEKPIKESETNYDWETNIYLTSLPGDWVFDNEIVSSEIKQLSIASVENKIAFFLAGIRVSSKWYFQRFVDIDYNGTIPDVVSFLLSTDEPAPPNTGRLYYDIYYDFDQCEFGTVENEEPFNLTIKSGDSYQINIPSDFIFEPEIGPESSQFPRIGIFDCNGQYLQDIGKIGFPDCVQTYETKIFYDFLTDQFFEFVGIGFGATFQPSYLKIYLVDSELNTAFLVQFSLDSAPGADILVDTASNFCVQLEALLIAYFGYDCAVTFTGGDGPLDRPEITVKITGNLCGIVAINFKFSYTFTSEIVTDVGLYTPIEPKLTGTQYQASITIPPLANSNYFIGIFQGYTIDDEGFSELLAISQPLQLDNFETFTQILEYGASENSVIEGFEYINGWLQKVRVPLNGAGQTSKSEESIYRNSDGTFQIPENSTDEVLYLHTDYLDLATQRAMISATKNPIFVLQGQNLSVQGDLEITNTQDFTQNSSFRKLQQMQFQALTQGYQPENNSCIG